MNAALVSAWGQSPTFGRTALPASPPPEGWVQVKVEAAGLHSLVRSRASGKHFSSGTVLPHIPGTDGVGLLNDGKRVYFSTFATGGSFCEHVNVPRHAVTPLPPNADAARMAALINPAMSSWMALRKRVFSPPTNFTVLILGVTSASGMLAVEVARALGAGRVIGVARDQKRMQDLALDDSITLADTPEKTDFASTLNKTTVDVVLDYLYGIPAQALLSAITTTDRPLQYVHIGGLAGLQLDLQGAVLRSKDITIRGSAPGSWSPASLSSELPQLIDVLQRIPIRTNVRTHPLQDIEAVWQSKASKEERIVFTPK